MQRRYELARGLMREQGLDYLVIFGNSGVNRHNHVPNAREISDVPNIEWGGYEPGKTIAKLVHGRVGLVGVNATWNDGMPWQHYLDLQHLELVDATREYASLRRIKSD